MKALVIGAGGREHSLVWKLKQSRHVDEVYASPGNAGMAGLAECVDTDKAGDFPALVDFVKYNWIDITVVGPEEPLSKGIVDVFEKEERLVVGPSKEASQLESSKIFSKDFMRKYGIPTAGYKVFNSYKEAEDYIHMKGAPIVVKADGLAAGKGVFVASTVGEAVDALKVIMKDRAFGDAGDRVVVEECLEGEEASYMAFTDGTTILPMSSSQDHKRALDGDKGPNTGGMGAYSPAPVVTPEVEQRIIQKVMNPFLKGMKSEGIRYKGIVYAGLMIKDGQPGVLEFNCRFGDPECQPIVMRLDTDLMDVSMALAQERLSEIELKWKPEAAVCVVLASGGYPGKYETGKVITGLKEAAKLDDVVVFHAGTAFDGDNIVTAGGRVLGVTALGADIKAAREKAYEAAKLIHFDGMQMRTDIADKAFNRT